jgi:hypothetical protein
MSIEVITDIKPANDRYHPVTKIQYVQGAYLSVPSLSDRNNIYPNIRATGMQVHVQSNGMTYRLSGGITNNDWILDPFLYYTHVQSVSSSSWLITHNLGYNPSINTFYVSGEIIGLISHPTGGVLSRVDFNKSYSGTGYCS